MALFARQVWALVRKNLLLICVRRPIYTFIRAIVLPLVIVLVVAYSKYFFANPQHYGVSSPHNLRTLEDGLASISGQDIVGFVDNGMKDGEVSSVIDSLSKKVISSGKTPRLFDDSWGLAQECQTSTKGVSPCYGAIVFASSPTEGTNESSAGTWNYTMRGEGASWGGGFADVRNDNNGPERTLLPLQRALDMEIIARSSSNNSTQLPIDTKVIVFTGQDQSVLDDSKTDNYLNLAIYVFGPIFVFTLFDIVYHMTSFIARERELGMSGLIDTMISGGSNVRGRIVRQIASYTSFAVIYFPSWLAVGIVISVLIFPEQSHGLPIGFLILAGLSFTSFSLFGASFFRKAQLSGSVMVVIIIVGAILPIVLFEQTKTTCTILSILFPSSNLSYFLTGVGTFEAQNKRVDMVKPAYDPAEEMDTYRLPLYAHWVIVVVHILVFPVFAFVLEHALFSTASPHRKFAQPLEPTDPTVTLSSFSKTYQPSILARIFRRKKSVHAVTGLDLKAYRGQILCLLGPNGCGKSTTLNCISGDQRVTSGDVTIDPTGGLGYAPQRNVIWPELTVEEHIRIFSDLKCLSPVNEEVVNELAKGVDLHKKLKARASTLSGGQKRKLQMALMFAGGSAVCCVDEVSTGLDPISRRRIWEILLAERSRRTIIMTTHFLDEADYLADDVAIMYKGTLRASGTAASLKHRYGDGYTVKLQYHTDMDVQLHGGLVRKEQSRHQTVFRVATAALATELVEELHKNQVHDYQISGPTMEELFLKITGDQIIPAEEQAGDEGNTETKKPYVTVNVTKGDYELTEGRPISAFKQWWILLLKRFKIFKRRFMPYLVAVAFAIIGAGVAPLLINKFKKPIPCPAPADLISEYTTRSDFGTSYYGSSYVTAGSSDLDDLFTKKYVFGPASRLGDLESRFNLMAETYSSNNTYQYSYGGSDDNQRGYKNSSQIIEQLILVDNYTSFRNAIHDNWDAQATRYSAYGRSDASPYTTIKGGVWLGDADSDPTILANIGEVPSVSQMSNMMSFLVGGVPISAAYSQFATTEIPNLVDFNQLMFIIYYGLIMCCYPVFFTLYPTNERISNVRSMQYSNGIRPVPLWLSHLAFDGIFILVISAAATGLLSASTPIWHGLGFIFVIFMLYGIVCALLSYVISMFAKSAVTAWFMMALGQVVFYFAYFGGVIGVQSSTPYSEMDGVMNALFYGLGIVSPAVCLERTLFIGLQMMAVMCNGHSSGSIYLYGGPILYLVLQAIYLFVLLLWWDSGFVVPQVRSHKSDLEDAEASDMYTNDLITERKRLDTSTTSLGVSSVSKSFGKNLAVDNVTFGVQQSEIFALLGPNGAGKSTIISMIRGDIKPSSPNSQINVAGHSVLTHAIDARASLGVCPQFDSADVLTVRETLRFFARTRGVRDVEHNVNTVIAACGLEEWSNQLAQKLSGGTKRKLSLAVALVGNPQVLVLDEPSSALDANAKRTLWRCLQTIAKGRAVVLTTHSMEEADALADRIGIVSSRMLALGDREELKRRAGQNFYIHFVAASAPRTTSEELQVMKSWIKSAFEHATISRETQGGQVRFEVPAEGRDMVALITLLESVKGDLGVEYYSIGKATLDEVFENIVRRYGDGQGVET